MTRLYCCHVTSVLFWWSCIRPELQVALFCISHTTGMNSCISCFALRREPSWQALILLTPPPFQVAINAAGESDRQEEMQALLASRLIVSNKIVELVKVNSSAKPCLPRDLPMGPELCSYIYRVLLIFNPAALIAWDMCCQKPF